MGRTLPGSKHFRLAELAQGVYAALAIPGTGAWANAGIVDLGDRTLVFDTCFTPRAALDLRAAAEQLTGRPATWVVNSHWHADHTHGNQVFADATIIATVGTQAAVAERGAGVVAELLTPGYLERLAAAVAREPDPAKQREGQELLADYRALLAGAESWQLCPPNLSFERRLVLHGGRRTAEVLSYGGGHTASDAFLWLPAEGILFAGDLVQVGLHVFLRDGDPSRWQAILAEMGQLGPAQVVPGHGPVADGSALAATAAYLADLQDRARAFVQGGGTPEQAAQQAVPAAYAGWGAPSVFGDNLRQLCLRLAGG